ncbi:MAG: hypothetical protein ACR2OC_11230 [Solirubrobacterales bacterium]
MQEKTKQAGAHLNALCDLHSQPREVATAGGHRYSVSTDDHRVLLEDGDELAWLTAENAMSLARELTQAVRWLAEEEAAAASYNVVADEAGGVSAI